MDARADVDEGDGKGPRRPMPEHVVALVRSAVYSVVATTYFIITTTLCAWVMVLPADRMRFLLNWWAQGDVWLLRIICGQRVVVRGRENMPTGAALVASKHQAAWETLALIPILPRGAIILKKELLKIPIYGWYARYYGMIPVDRSGGPAALKQLAADAKAAIDDGFQIIIFPEGTRQLVGAPPDYKPGAIFLYERLKVPMVPVALNSGLLWPRRRFVRYPGTITVSFLPAIPPGLKRGEAKERLQTAIERETDRLVAQATVH
ncbi:MAG: lysophospholipid acyltransferase family protein [Pseudomonadota bacterium]